MEDRELTVKQLTRLLRKYIGKWKSKLFLGMWNVDFNVRDFLTADINSSFHMVARCSTKWNYFTVQLDFSHVMLASMSDAEIERVVLHELLHVVVNEMREDGVDHEERVVSHLTMIFAHEEDLYAK